MQFTLHVQASLPAGGGSSTPDGAWQTEVVTSPVAVRLRGVVSVDYDIRVTGPDESPFELSVTVSFPDEARALLEHLSWRQAESIVDTLFEIGAAYAARSVASRWMAATGRPADRSAACAPTALRMPLASFRAGLDGVRASTTEPFPRLASRNAACSSSGAGPLGNKQPSESAKREGRC